MQRVTCLEITSTTLILCQLIFDEIITLQRTSFYFMNQLHNSVKKLQYSYLIYSFQYFLLFTDFVCLSFI